MKYLKDMLERLGKALRIKTPPSHQADAGSTAGADAGSTAGRG
jgi:hypothetical protein